MQGECRQEHGELGALVTVEGGGEVEEEVQEVHLPPLRTVPSS